jgi:hypothetical protein
MGFEILLIHLASLDEVSISSLWRYKGKVPTKPTLAIGKLYP